MNVELNQDQFRDVQAMLADVPKGALKAVVRAINHTLGTTKTMAATEIGQRMNLTKTRIKADLIPEKANYSNPSGKLAATGEPISLTSFSNTRQTLKGVSVQVLTTTPRTLLKHAFIATSHNSQQVFWRKWTGTRTTVKPTIRYGRLPIDYRQPIERLTGPRIEDIYSKPEVIGAVITKAGVKLHERLNHEADYLLSQYQQKLYGAD